MHSLIQKITTHYYTNLITSRLLTFSVKDQSYHYFCHRYNATWKNERAVEVPTIWDAVQTAQKRGFRILEIGNVLSHYFPTTHDVVDKYEKVPGVINKDIVTFKPGKKYDLIVAISTLEHVGWDEKPKDPTKTKKAVSAIKKLLTKKGRAIITIPLGYNPHLDELLKTKAITFNKSVYLKRTNELNHWVETTHSIVGKTKYGEPFSNANGLVIGYLEK